MNAPLLISCACAALAASVLTAQPPSVTPGRGSGSPHFELQELTGGVWVAINADSSSASANAAIIDLGDATLVFDAFFTPEAGAALRAAAERVTGRPVRYLALSHWHNDHARGAQSFGGSTIISSSAMRDLLLVREPAELKWEKGVVDERLQRARDRLAAEKDPQRRRERLFWSSYYDAMKQSHPLLKIIPPEVTFERRLVIHGTKRSVELLEMRGHTGSDVIAWLPAERIALMGDLLFVEYHAYLPDGDPDAHRATLRAVKDLRPERLLPGHGPVSGPGSLDTLIAYIDDAELLGRALWTRKATIEDALKEVAPATYEGWWFSNFWPANMRFFLRRAMAADSASRR